MAYIQTEIKLPLLSRTIATHLYFPTDLPESVGNKINGVITLLHGFSNTGSDWIWMTSAPRYAADNGYVLVAPNADNSFYNDMQHGTPFYTAIAEQLPQQLRSIFKLPDERDKNFIAGLSMGGYGAMRIGMLHPERYSVVGSFSGALDVGAMAAAGQTIPEVRRIFEPVFGNQLEIPKNADLFALADNLSRLPNDQQPRLYCSCGAQDQDETQILYQNQRFKQHVEKLPLGFRYDEWDGVHEFSFWDRSIAEFIGYIKNNDYASRKSKDWSAAILPGNTQA